MSDPLQDAEMLVRVAGNEIDQVELWEKLAEAMEGNLALAQEVLKLSQHVERHEHTINKLRQRIERLDPRPH